MIPRLRQSAPAIVALGALAAVFALVPGAPAQSRPPVPLASGEAAGIRGMGCKATSAPFPCSSGISTLCSTTYCTSGWTSWYCASGITQITNLGAFLTNCNDIGAAKGLTGCAVAGQVACLQAQNCNTAGSCLWPPGTNTPYCPGPTGPVLFSVSPASVATGSSCPVPTGSGPVYPPVASSQSGRVDQIAMASGRGFTPF